MNATTLAELQATLKANYPDGLPRYMTPEEQQYLNEQKAIELLQAPLMAPQAAPQAGPLTQLPGTVYTPAEYEPALPIQHFDLALRFAFRVIFLVRVQ